MDLPIDLVPMRVPPCFRWKYRTDTLNGPVVQTCEGSVAPSLEAALANLIELTKRLQQENKGLWDRIEKMQPQQQQASVKAKGK